MRNPIVLPLFWLWVVVGFGLGFTLGLGVATDAEEDFVVEDVPKETDGPDCGAYPKRGTCRRTDKECGCGVGAEIGAHEGTIDDVESYTRQRNADVGF